MVLSRFRHWLILLLFTVLPFHAFLVTVATKLVMGPGHPPLLYLAIWKELLMVVIFTLGIIEFAFVTLLPRIPQYTSILREGVRGGVKIRWKADMPTICIVALLVLAFVTQIPNSQFLIPNSQFAFGFKYLFLPLIFFLVLKSLPWDTDFLERKVFPALLFVSAIVASYGILTFFLPQTFFSALGYSDAHSLYSPTTPLSAFQMISGAGIRRIQSTFAGPNQLGMWLLVPLSIVFANVLRRNPKSEFRLPIRSSVGAKEGASCFVLCLVAVALFLTFSRAAWLSAFIIALVAVWIVLRGPVRETILITLVTAACVSIATLAYSSPQLFLRSISNKHHLERVRSGVAAILEEPLGRGLGTAGPASNRLQDACVYFPDGADTSWARARKGLCIFVGKAQVQPLLTERKCECAFLPENWYLQVGVELGILGLVFFVILVLSILYSLLTTTYHLPPFLAFLGISIAALFLHAWEDSAVAYTVWGIAGIALAEPKSPPWPSRLRAFFSCRC